jgi:hypothetical protein
MRTHKKAVFSALIRLEPLAGPAAQGGRASSENAAELDPELAIARIMSVPRRRLIDTHQLASATGERGAPDHRPSRLGAAGLLASAAVALVSALLWASPSAGAPPSQATAASTSAGRGASARPVPPGGRHSGLEEFIAERSMGLCK